MPYENLRALVHATHPNVTVSQLTAAAGAPNSRLAHWFKPSTKADDMPPTRALKEIARIVGLPLRDVAEACAADAGIPWGPDQSFEGEVKRLARSVGVDWDLLYDVANDPAIPELLRERRRIAPQRRDTLVQFALSLAGGPDVADWPPRMPDVTHWLSTAWGPEPPEQVASSGGEDRPHGSSTRGPITGRVAKAPKRHAH